MRRRLEQVDHFCVGCDEEVVAVIVPAAKDCDAAILSESVETMHARWYDLNLLPISAIKMTFAEPILCVYLRVVNYIVSTNTSGLKLCSCLIQRFWLLSLASTHPPLSCTLQ